MPAGQWRLQGDQLTIVFNGIVERPTADEIYGMVFESDSNLRGNAIEGFELGSSSVEFDRFPAELSAQIDLIESRTGPCLALSISASGNGHSVQITDLRSRFADHIVINGTWHPFAPGAKEEILALLLQAGIDNTGLLTLRQYLDLRRMASRLFWLHDNTDGLTDQLATSASNSPDTPELFTGTLYPYQLTGWRWLSYIWREQLGAILADEMGLGKTIQLIALLASPERNMAAPALVVCPATLLENWRRELLKFAPGLSTYIHQGTTRTGDYLVLNGHDVVITSYDTVVRDGSMFRMIEWQIMILDEAQAIKNPETKRAISVKKLRRKVSVAVTGTPIENRLRDLWSLVDFALPSYLGNEDTFVQTYPDERVAAAALEPLVSPIMLRRRVHEVAKDLPPRIDIPQILELSDWEALNYERTRQEILVQYHGNATLVALAKLRMFCAHPLLLDDQPWSVEKAFSFSKFQRLFELVEEIFANSEKLLVFTSYNRMATAIERTIRERYGYFADTINGDTPIGNRQDIVDAFSKVPGPGALVLNPRAAGQGLNITAANHVVHYNLEWNPAIEDQASARAYRRGQDRPVTIHRLYYADTVEEAMNDRLDRKRELSETAVVGVEGSTDDYSDLVRAMQASPVRKG